MAEACCQLGGSEEHNREEVKEIQTRALLFEVIPLGRRQAARPPLKVLSTNKPPAMMSTLPRSGVGTSSTFRTDSVRPSGDTNTSLLIREKMNQAQGPTHITEYTHFCLQRLPKKAHKLFITQSVIYSMY